MLKALWSRLTGVPRHDPVAFRDLEARTPRADVHVSDHPEHPVTHLGQLCRLTLLDRQERVAAHEFLLRGQPTDRMRDVSAATLRLYDHALLSNLLHLDLPRLIGSRLALITLTPAGFDEPALERLSSRRVVLAVAPRRGAPLDAHAVERLQALASHGYALAYPIDVLDEHRLPPPALLIVDFHSLPLDSVRDRLREARRRWPKAGWIAKGLDNEDAFTACYDGHAGVDFDLFHGPFVTRREDWHAPRVDVRRSHLLRIIGRLREDAPLPEIVELVRQDPRLVYKLMRYLGSASVNLDTKPVSLEQALMVIGRGQLTRWLTVLLYLGPEDRSRDLVLLETALARAHLMESTGTPLLGAAHADPLFLTGLFSLIDLVLQQPLLDALAPIHLPAAVVDALLAQDGPYSSYLTLAQACEQFGPEAQTQAAALGLTMEQVSKLHLDALAWAQSTLQD